MQYFRNQDKFLRTEVFLNDELGDDIKANKMKLMADALYANKEVEIGGSTLDLLDGASQSVRGITNFDGRQLSKGRVFVAHNISFGWVVAAKGTPVHSVNYSYSTIPSYLRFGNIVVKQNDEVVLRMPLFDLVNSNGSGHNSNSKEIGNLSLLLPELPVEFYIEMPNGAKAGLKEGESLYVSGCLSGMSTLLKR